MIKIKIAEYQEQEIENAGCNNGNYPQWAGLDAETGDALAGDVCRCRKGCSNTDMIEIDGEDVYWIMRELR